MKNLKYYFMVIAAGIFIGINFRAAAQEHPSEHPKGGSGQLTVSELSKAAEKYVKKEGKAHDGYFVVQDGDKTLQLTLSKVHDDRLSPLGDDVYFVCADFTAQDGTVYDVDIFMKGTLKDNLEATETSIHKVNGKERYTWHEANGVWKKKTTR
jgi:hypothetical protein